MPMQKLSMGRRYDRGEHRVGVEMGLTSRAKMLQIGVSEIVWGRLTDAMRLVEGGDLAAPATCIRASSRRSPISSASSSRASVAPVEALAAVEAIAPAVEIIDSRYRDFRFTLPDVIADNSSSSGFSSEHGRDPADVRNPGILMDVDGRPVQIGSSAAILGNPIRSLVAAARAVANAGETLEPGDIVLAGGATAAHPITPGEYIRTWFQDLGSVSFSAV